MHLEKIITNLKPFTSKYSELNELRNLALNKKLDWNNPGKKF
ncbi:hypothetical protein [Lacinutrix jangbogonensis]|nr:hypothetical protein [Lacinutrix jangbogonensis]